MKQLVLLVILFCELTLTAATVQPGLKYSQYPNTPTFHPSDLMLMATTNTSPPTNKNMKMGDLALQIVNSNKVVVLDGTNTLVVNTFTNGTNFYAVNSTASGGDAGGTNARQFGFLSLTNLALNPNVVTNILGAGTVTVTSNNLGTFTITGAASGFGVGLAPGTTTITVDGSVDGIYNRTSVLTSDVSVLFENMIVGVPTRWWGFASNGAWNVTVPQSHDSNLVSRGIEQPFTNNWVWVEALKISTAWTNFDSKAPPFTIGPGTNTVFDTNLATRHIMVSAAGASGGGIPSGYQTNQFTTNVAGSPVLGAIWFNGTNGITPPMTNGARVGVEWTPVQRALRIGEIGNNGVGHDVFDSTTLASNYWHATNIGFGSTVIGSNSMAKGPYSFVQGIYNITHSNAVGSTITGGSNNIIYTNVGFAHIGGGSDHTIRYASYGTIGGGLNNDMIGTSTYSAIGGGNANQIEFSLNGTIGGGSANSLGGIGSSYGTIGGGSANQVNSSQYGTIAGGTMNTITATAPSSTIGGGGGNVINGVNSSTISGGNANQIVGGSDYAAVGGGDNNFIQSGSAYSVIAGGRLNLIGASTDFNSVLGGASNQVFGTMATVVGNFITNGLTSTVQIGHGDSRKVHVDANGLKVNVFTNITGSVGGTLSVQTTPIASAGASETNLMSYVLERHSLTNSNDRLMFRASGRFAATANAKQIKVIYGSETILDTGSQIVNSGAWTIEGEIIRTGNTSQSVNAEFHGAGVTLFNTASSLDLAQTNGIATTLKLTGTAAGDGDITNRTLVVEWFPAP